MRSRTAPSCRNADLPAALFMPGLVMTAIGRTDHPHNGSDAAVDGRTIRLAITWRPRPGLFEPRLSGSDPGSAGAVNEPVEPLGEQGAFGGREPGRRLGQDSL